MVDTRRVLRIFLASPGDLKTERRAAKSVVDEHNQNWADHFGHQVELVAWEDTLSESGRPQATINRDMERCEFFIGVLWKRWGTPPGNGSDFSSGFAEEFQMSLDNNQAKGAPEIGLYFKKVHDDLLRDPGIELKKVLAFKERMRAEQRILFDEFCSVEEFKTKINRRIVRWAQELESKEADERAPGIRSRPSEDESPIQTEEAPAATTPLTVEGNQFLQDLLSGSASEIEAADVARFRLLSDIIGNQTNDAEYLGVHDANILFARRSSLDLSMREKAGLVDAGLVHYLSGVAPLWYWLAQTHRLWLQHRSLFGPEPAKIGALSAMEVMREPISSDLPWTREQCIGLWLSDTSPSELKLAALKYLARCGVVADLPAIQKEMDRGDYQTGSATAEAIIRIRLREGRANAIQTLFDLQPRSIGSGLLSELFPEQGSIDTELLSQGIEHQDVNIRRMGVKLLRARGALDPERANQLTSDSDAEVRFEALRSLRDGVGISQMMRPRTSSYAV